ncbi:MAG: hypothetical protein KGK08_04665 [Acidobacteriota bacterium]|nr:hypothetical protein [Acidobacteriota bacterium]
MAESVPTTLVAAQQVAQQACHLRAPNGIAYAIYGEGTPPTLEIERLVQAVPRTIAAALARKVYFFVPLVMSDDASQGQGLRRSEPVMVAAAYAAELTEVAICHRNVTLEAGDGVFISSRLLSDRFALAFEFFINVGHAFVDAIGVPTSFAELAWAQVVSDVRGETSQDAWESRNLALATGPVDGKPRIDERAKTSYLESAFSDALAIYLLSLAVDFDYAELREREYPLLAPQALAERLRLVAKLFHPNPGYEFAIRYRRRA